MTADRTPAPVAVPEGGWQDGDWMASTAAVVYHFVGGEFHRGERAWPADFFDPWFERGAIVYVHAPRPEPVVAPLPTEAVEAAARALDEAFAGYGVHDVGVTATERLARTVVAAALPHLRLVPEDDEGTVLRQWADWIEGGEAAAGLPEPFTLRTVIDAMRSGRRPFGTFAGDGGPR